MHLIITSAVSSTESQVLDTAGGFCTDVFEGKNVHQLLFNTNVP